VTLCSALRIAGPSAPVRELRRRSVATRSERSRRRQSGVGELAGFRRT